MEQMSKTISDFVAYEGPQILSREEFTASGAVHVGDIVTGTVAGVNLYGVAAADAKSGEKYPAIIRQAAIVSAAYESIAEAAQEALVEQGCKLL